MTLPKALEIVYGEREALLRDAKEEIGSRTPLLHVAGPVDEGAPKKPARRISARDIYERAKAA